MERGLLRGSFSRIRKQENPDSLFPSLVCERAMQKGLLMVHTGRESIKLGPPLIIPEAALVEGLNVFFEAIEEIDRESDQ